MMISTLIISCLRQPQADLQRPILLGMMKRRTICAYVPKVRKCCFDIGCEKRGRVYAKTARSQT